MKKRKATDDDERRVACGEDFIVNSLNRDVRHRHMHIYMYRSILWPVYGKPAGVKWLCTRFDTVSCYVTGVEQITPD